ncbi:hypothetical protein LB577_18880 [Mesorhizobium sp. B283B1A]|uniref:hypothetical protein n=1 Tax=Mesorhizobium TaxID=68287 RepID=UPI001CD1330B|nr:MULTISPECIES: hypothetical protein [Mesorhizobium]MCA0048989.1 hypothetical protein [Mesorhizobium sp. B283B1A]UQS62628.1 hypothetical protein M5D98_20975 [Mesorhizobium opportunistum]
MLDGIVGGADPTSWVAKAYDIAGYLVATLGFQDLIAGSENSEQSEEMEEPGVMRSG